MPRKGQRKGVKSDLMKLKREVKNLQTASEVKTHDEYFPKGQVAYNANQVTTMLDPVQGFTNSTRIGDEISAYRINLRGVIEANAASAGNTQLVRVVLLQSKEGFVPSTTAVTTTNQLWVGNNAVYAPLSAYDEANRKHFTILYDKTFATDTNSQKQVLFNINKKISRPTRFDLGGSTVAKQGQLYLCMTSNYGTGSAPQVTFYSRISYKD